MTNLSDFPRPNTERERQERQVRERVAQRITDAMMETLLPKMRERPLSAETREFIVFRLEQDARRVARLLH